MNTRQDSDIFTEEEFELLKVTLELGLKEKYETYKEHENVNFSDRFKRKINRIFREHVGIKNIPHPEVDNFYEKSRGRIVRFWLRIVNKFNTD